MAHTVVDIGAAVVAQGGYPVLAEADLRVEASDLVLLRGPNGAGKTSMLRLCAGLSRPSRGRVEVLGRDLMVDHRTVRSMVGYLGHGLGLFDDLSARQNLKFWHAAEGLGSSGSDVDGALDAVGLPVRSRDLAVGRLSEGQRKRTALATVVLRRPQLWLLDEPHAGLDPEGRDRLDSLMNRATESGATVLFSSHEEARAEQVASVIVDMSGGQVVSVKRLADGAT